MFATILASLEAEATAFAGKFAAGLLGAVLLFGVGFYKGDHYRAAVDDAAGAQAKIEFLQRQIAARDEAEKTAAADAAAAKDRLAQLEKEANEAVQNITPGPCLDGGDADRLRSLWPKQPKPKNRNPKPKARATP